MVGCIIGAILIGVRIFQRGKSVPGPQDKIEAKIYFAAEKAHLTKYAVMAAKESGLYTPQKIGEKVGKARNLEKFLAKYTTERHEQLKRAGQETAMRHLEQLEAGASIIEFNGVNYRTNRSGSTIQLEPSELITSKALLWVVFFGAFGVTIALLITSDLYFKDEKGNKMPRDGFIYLFFVSFSGLVASLTTTLFRFAGSKGVLGRFAKRMHAVGEEQRGGIQEVAAKVMPAFELMRAATEKGAEAVKEEESAFILTFENRARSVDPIDALTKE